MSLGVKKLCYDAIVPTRGSDRSVGYDLYSSEDAMVPSQAGRAIVGTGITVVLPPGVYGRVAPRSGLAAKHCINVGAGVIDMPAAALHHYSELLHSAKLTQTST